MRAQEHSAYRDFGDRHVLLPFWNQERTHRARKVSDQFHFCVTSTNYTSAWYWTACLPLSNMFLYQSRLASAPAMCWTSPSPSNMALKQWNHRHSPRRPLGCLWHNQPSETAWEGLQHDKGLRPDVHDSHSTGELSLLRGTRREKK